jgi:D-alanine-D-alanine ligase
MEQFRVGVLRGGGGPEYWESLSSGEHVLKSLNDSYSPVDILVDKEGTWHIWGVPVHKMDVAKHVDVVFNTLLGSYGEDGFAQRALEAQGTPYTGSTALASAICSTRHIMRDKLRGFNVKTPRTHVVRKGDNTLNIASDVHKTLSPPWLIRFSSPWGSHNQAHIKSFNELVDTIEAAQGEFGTVLIEEFIRGNPATCFVIEGSSEETHVLGVGGDRTLSSVAHELFQKLGLRNYARMNFLISQSGEIYLTSAYAFPDISKESLFVRQLNNVGIPFSEFVDHTLQCALNQK